MKPLRTRTALSALALAAALLSGACANSQRVVDPESFPGPDVAAASHPVRGVMVQSDRLAQNVMLQMAGPDIASVPSGD